MNTHRQRFVSVFCEKWSSAGRQRFDEVRHIAMESFVKDEVGKLWHRTNAIALNCNNEISHIDEQRKAHRITEALTKIKCRFGFPKLKGYSGNFNSRSKQFRSVVTPILPK